jgi:prepilin-type processing-associated H-X9-DG protein
VAAIGGIAWLASSGKIEAASAIPGEPQVLQVIAQESLPTDRMMVKTHQGTPAEKTSFGAVSEHLDAGGNFYLYLSSDQSVAKIDGALEKLLQGFDVMPGNPTEKAKRAAIGQLAREAINQSGVTEISGIGMSSFATEPQFYRNRMVVHHYKEQANGKLWALFGSQEHPLQSLDLMPLDTVFALSGDFDLKVLWNWINELATASQLPDLQQQLQMLTQMLTAQGLLPEQLFGSLSGSMTLALTLNPNQQTSFPIKNGQTIRFPSPSLLIMLGTRNDFVFDRFKSELNRQKAPVSDETYGDARLMSLQLPIPSPVPVIPTIAQEAGFLLIGSNPQVIKNAIDANTGKAAGLKSTAEFKKLSAGIPVTGNQWHFVSRKASDVFADLQQQLVSQTPDQARRPIMKLLTDAQETGMVSYGVGQMTDEGMFFTANSNASAGKVVLIQTAVVPVAIGAGMLLPALSNSREKARRINDAGNLKQIGLGLRMYSSDHQEQFPEDLAVLWEQSYLSAGKVFVCPASHTKQPMSANELREGQCDYIYFGKDATESSHGASNPIAATRPGIFSGEFINVLYADGHVRGYAQPPESVKRLLVEQNNK